MRRTYELVYRVATLKVLFTASVFLAPIVVRGDYWQQVRILTAADSVDSIRFGRSVAIDGNIAVVGASAGNGVVDLTGAAYLFDVTTGNQIAKLTAHDGIQGDGLGFNVAISGSYAAVGGFTQNDIRNHMGVAYVFGVPDGVERAGWTSPDGYSGAIFDAVGISGDHVVVGAYGGLNSSPYVGYSGAAYIFSASTGALQHKLELAAPGSFDLFGGTVAISGDIAIVGAKGDDDQLGSAYLFDAVTGNQLQMLRATDAAVGKNFAQSVSISGNVAIVGAPSDFNNGKIRGAAYLFDVTTGEQLAKLIPSNPADGGEFGMSVSISGNLAIVGAPLDNGDKGAAYIFDVTTGNQLARLTSANARQFDYFGGSVSISGTTAIVGGYFTTSRKEAASVFQLVPEPATTMLLGFALPTLVRSVRIRRQ